MQVCYVEEILTEKQRTVNVMYLLIVHECGHENLDFKLHQVYEFLLNHVIDNYFVASDSNRHDIARSGAAYGEVFGYERPLFFKPDEVRKKDFEDLSKQGTFGKAWWFNTVKKEYHSIILGNRFTEILSGESIYCNGEYSVFVTSAVHGFTLGKQTCLGLVPAPSSEKITVNYIRGATYEIDTATKRFKARPNVYQAIEMCHTVLLYIN
ncbi:unnamed protein product [Adineta steineri]|uniref:Aminomethyltransferase C-terminal domain-containing protein n=1 Tax=Adineta steineri TaxID=433720 RepID=A0A819H637_9BILA|nr:unnamed protein product [Adineta steineri]CAF1428470.1 unnamed protein product [Adineta steineri]CAF3896757.1 unnamed protein product [Adineta steineri]CAF4065479.1 unnamed protein product [Adineta steineri]